MFSTLQYVITGAGIACVWVRMKAGEHVVRSTVGPNDCSNKLRLSHKPTMVSTVKERWQIISCAFQCCAMEVGSYPSSPVPQTEMGITCFNSRLPLPESLVLKFPLPELQVTLQSANPQVFHSVGSPNLNSHTITVLKLCS